MTTENGFFTTEAQRTQRTATKANMVDPLNSSEIVFGILAEKEGDVKRQFSESTSDWGKSGVRMLYGNGPVAQENRARGGGVNSLVIRRCIMATASDSIEIEKSLEEVWEYVTDFQRNPEWLTQVVEVRVSPGPLAWARR